MVLFCVITFDLANCHLVTGRQQRAYDIVREHLALTASPVNRRNCVRFPNSSLATGREYYTAVTIRQSAKTGTDTKIPKAELSLNWTDPFKLLVVDPRLSAHTPDESPLGAKPAL